MEGVTQIPSLFVGMQTNVLGYLQGPQDAAVTLETAPVLEVPTVRAY